ncbi:MAG: sigma-70 family RNA polymerase sigma factor [Candidatus Aminicenantes bacterium]|nr:sigma-70 family RNA polymerase sigma factor [Candidatus Aminicenantes bacterium]
MSRERREAVSKTAFWDKLTPCKFKLYNYIRKSLNFSADADDVFQETVLHAFQYIGSYKDGQDFGAWLFGIAHNEIKKHYKRILKTAAPIELGRLSFADTSPTRHLVGEVYRYAEQLNPRQREVFFLFYDGGFSMAEISSITGLREGNIKFILNQARTALKTILGVSHDR